MLLVWTDGTLAVARARDGLLLGTARVDGSVFAAPACVPWAPGTGTPCVRVLLASRSDCVLAVDVAARG